jgi:outer membrane protein, heavy metal efflux system
MIKLCFVLLIILNVYSQDLQRFIDLAKQNNPILKSYDARMNSIENMANSSSYLPDPNFQASYFINEIVTANGPQIAQLSLSQMIPWFGSLSLKSESIRESKFAFNEQKKLYQLDLRNKISKFYYQLASIQAKDSILSDYLDVLESFYKSTLSHYENGNGLQQDILKVQTEISSMKNSRIVLRSAMKRHINDIKKFTFQQMDTIIAEFPSKLDTPVGNALIEENHEIKSLLHLRKESVLKQELSSAKKLPNLMLGFSYNIINEKMGISGNKDAFAVMLGFSLPIWSGKYSSEEEIYINQMNEIDYKIQGRTLEIKERIDFLYYDLKSKEESLALFRNELITKAQLTFKASLSAYETGKTDFINLLDSKRMLLKLALQELETKTMYYISLSDYKRETSYLRDGEQL